MQKKIQKLFVDFKRISTLRPYLAVDYIRKNIGYDSFLSEKKEGSETWMEIADCIQESYRNLASLDEWQSAEDENEAANSPQQRNTEDESKKRNGVPH